MRYSFGRAWALVALPLALALLALAPVAGAQEGGNALEKKANFDVRQTPASRAELRGRAAGLPPAAAALKESLGVEGVVAFDPLTGTARAVGRTDGFLTGPSNAGAATVALDYASRNAAALGLTQQALSSLELVRDYVSIDGTHHLSYRQSIGGVPVFGNGLKANVAGDGRLVNVLGSPLRGESAQQVYFRTVAGNRLAYETVVGSGSGLYLAVVDAQSERVLYRRSLVDHATGQVLDYYPNAAAGGTRHSADLDAWLSAGATTLTGPNTHVYSDADDSDKAETAEETTKDATGNFNYAFTEF